MRLQNLPSLAAKLTCAILAADFLAMLGMNVFRLYTHWLPILYFALLFILGLWIFRDGLIVSDNACGLSDREQSILAAAVVAVALLFAGARVPYFLEGHLHRLVGPVVYDDTWHFQEISSLVNSLRYPAHCSLVPHSYFSFYYAPWMLVAALYLAIPAAGFTIKAAFAVGCAIYQILICLTLLHIAISKARSRTQIYWAIYLIGCWAGLESIFALLYYLRHNAWWLLVFEMPIHFPIFGVGMVWAVHHISAAAALLLCWFIWDGATTRNWQTAICCALLIGFSFYASVFVFLGALPFGIFVASAGWRRRWRPVVGIALLSAATIWPMLWLYIGKTSDVRFMVPFIGSVHALFPVASAAGPFVRPDAHGSAQAMWFGFAVFLGFLCLNFLSYAIALACWGKRLCRSNRVLACIAAAFLVSTYFIGFQEGDNYASRGFLIPIFILGWICAGMLPSVRGHKWIVPLLLLGAFGSLHEAVRTYKRAVYISHAMNRGKYEAEIYFVNRDRHVRIVHQDAWQDAGLIYEVEKFVAGGKKRNQLVTADRQLECPGPHGPWRWQRIPDNPPN